MATTENNYVQGLAKLGPWRALLIGIETDSCDLVIDLRANGEGENGIVKPVNEREYNFFFLRCKDKGKWIDRSFTCSHPLAVLFREHECRLSLLPFVNPW